MKTLIFALIFTTPLFGSEKPSFDDVVYENTVVSTPVEAGFGTQKLLEVLEQSEVRASYDELRSFGKIKVSVKKLHASSYYTSKRVVYTFTAFQVRAWAKYAPVASFTVEVYTQQGMTTKLPTMYEVSKITKK